PEGRRPEDQLAGVRVRVLATSARIERLCAGELRPALEKEGIRLVDTEDLTDEDRAWSANSFAERIFPVLTPLAVDPAHPFPYISNLSLNLAVLVRDPVTGVRRFARLKMPPLRPRSLLMRELELNLDQIYETDGLLDLGALWGLVALDRPELKEPPWTPVTPSRLMSEDGPPDVFRVLRDGGDILVHHPYDSFSSSV